MRLFNRKSQQPRLTETINDSLEALSEMKINPTKGKILTAGLVAGGLAALTAGSAGISSLRRRQGGARDEW